ncbi:MAG: hypothetical protein KatS3mg011_1056 [Acidimicrobiia bacterium]|nr:MAG: hypothetical protein KatS3mg011_1056 [Acidimicrobiia bacterium]
MPVVGVDLASRPEGTWLCRLEHTNGGVRAVLEGGVDDDRLLEAAETADKVGVDAPFGWPDAFVEAVSAHHRRTDPVWPDDPGRLRLRETDRWVWERTGRPPLSVSSDRVAVPAMRLARFFARWQHTTGEDVDRAGRGRFVEVYPAAALRVWGLDPTGYKAPGGTHRRAELVEALLRRLGPVEVPRSLLLESHDAFDALVCALVASAARRGRTAGVPSHLTDPAAREGWIHLPEVSLEELLH